MMANENALQQYQQQGYNVLVPTTHMRQISPFHQQRIEVVKIDPNPDNGETFKVGSKKVGNSWQDVLSLSKPAIMKLASATGVIWNPQETRVLTSTRDYVLYQAVGAVRKPSGEWLQLKATKEIDLTVVEDEVRYQKEEQAQKYSKDAAWIDDQVRSNMIQWRKNKLMRAETGAMLRVVRALLSLKMQYSPQELQQPFAVPRVDFSPDYSDPQVRAMIQQEGMKATAAVFGQAAPALSPGQQMSQAMDVSQFDEVQDDQRDWTPGSSDEPIDVPAHEPPSDEDWDVPEDVPNYDEDMPEELDDDPAAPHCADCGTTEMSQKVIDYSTKRFGEPVCFDCQKARDGK